MHTINKIQLGLLLIQIYAEFAKYIGLPYIINSEVDYNIGIFMWIPITLLTFTLLYKLRNV